jgi:hypothetical protein
MNVRAVFVLAPHLVEVVAQDMEPDVLEAISRVDPGAASADLALRERIAELTLGVGLALGSVVRRRVVLGSDRVW